MTQKCQMLLGLAATISAAVLDLPVEIRNSYSSVKFSIGSPPKEHNLLLDTGSSTSWLINTDCTESSCPDRSSPYYTRQPYNASASSTSVDLDIPATIPFLGGDVSGQTYQDTFSVPGDDNGLEWNQTFLSANTSTWRFITSDGFLGLGFSSIAEPNTSTLVETLLQQSALDSPRFGLFYGTNLRDTGPQNGVLTLGSSHENKYVDGETIYTPLRKEDPYQLWRAPLRSVNVLVAQRPNLPNSTVQIINGKLPTTSLTPGTFPRANTTWPMFGAGRAVFDTGAGRLSLPDEIIGAVYFNLGWNLTKLYSGEERMTCAHLNASWAITLTLGEAEQANDVSFSLRGDEFTIPGDQCMLPVDASGATGFALVGAAFLRRVYSVWDFGAHNADGYEPRIGFGRLKPEWDYMYQ
ncbi:aspartic peptidase domain-containing protein [Ampelomyces quisqualis]|uniref:Aspartic peptidase domain-containing protein n=1 Tax=Ampelomyces quisqualis TaxID=50730 RepID=A0A6A5QV02_AMPQU|nr:aspartic peptidase domain-containing protein [Ampelomyces quisqualis]